MAALAPPPYRSSPSPLPSFARTSSSTTISSTPSKKLENSSAIAAGRRRLEEFKRKKASKDKAASIPTTSDEPAQNLPESEQPLPPASIKVPISHSKRVESNGHDFSDSRNGDSNVDSMQGSSSTEVAMVSTIHREHTSSPPVSKVRWSSGEDVWQESDARMISSGGSSINNPLARESRQNALEQPITSLSGTSFGKPERGGHSLPGLDSTHKNRVSIPSHPLGAARPLFVPAPPPASQEKSFPLNLATEQGKPEATATKNPVGGSPPFSQIYSTQGFQSSFNPSNQKLDTSKLVMLGTKLVQTRGEYDEHFSTNSSELVEESASASLGKVKLLSAPTPFNGRTDKQTDVITSTSASRSLAESIVASSSIVKLKNEKGSVYPTVHSSVSVLPPSLGIETSLKVSGNSTSLHPPFSEVGAPKYLPLPPPLFRPSITSSFKPELFVLPVFNNASDPVSSSSSTPSSTFPSTPSFLGNNAFPRPSPPNFQFPPIVSTINSDYANGNADDTVESFKPVLPRPFMSVGEFATQPIKVAETLDQSSQLWPTSSGREDFAMLEQHIEDLTQEKFSLRRGLDAARALAETLAQDNSVLTEDYNNQGTVVNELKAETERQHGEIRAQSVVVKKMKAERDKAVQECNAAVERSQALAAEVIVLEEKVLRARSQELKLKRDMESLAAETESQRRQILSLDKDQANLKSLVDALQEEKGLLQAQIWKATAGGSSSDLRHGTSGLPFTVSSKADAFTSTDGFELESMLMLGQDATIMPHSASQNSLVQCQLMGYLPSEQQHGQPRIAGSANPSRPLLSPSYANQAFTSFSSLSASSISGQSLLGGRGLNLDPICSVIPPDQTTTIQNINILITELAQEKEALLKSLRSESAGAAELRTLNADLCQKLEAQTQRLELAVAQSMAHGTTPKVGTTYAVSRIGPEYVDEGDEVVDRVLGWIMQLFPSGSSRRKRL